MRTIGFSVLFGLYLGVILGLTLIPGAHETPVRRRINLEPLKTIASDWRNGGRGFVINFWGNLVAFAPFGAFLMVLSKGAMKFWKVAGIAAAASFCIECAQFIRGGRVSDVDDVLLNAGGAWVGAVAWSAILGVRSRLASPVRGPISVRYAASRSALRN